MRSRPVTGSSNDPSPEDRAPEARREAGRWVLDPTASSVAFRHRTLWGLATVRGDFTGVAGEGESRADGSVRGTLTIDTASLHTKNRVRDRHLRSAAFFAPADHPTITYVVENVRAVGEGGLAVTGTLDVRGISRPLIVPATVAEDADGGAWLRADVDIDRSAFGMTKNPLGMLRGVATVSVVARFRRATPVRLLHGGTS
jgi:polyisoprenoid-binding protein YceI